MRRRGKWLRVLAGAATSRRAGPARFGPVYRGMRIEAGQVVGYVGTTGNARGTPPHLHYGIYNLTGATNPYPLIVTGWGSSTTSSGSR